jgi:HD-like signal output (HDOD) protein
MWLMMPVLLERRAQYRERGLRGLNDLPPFSPVLNRLLADLGRDDASFGKLSDLIEKDTVIAGRVLNIVNSAAYARANTVTSVRSAIAVLGINKLRNIVLGLSVSRMWSRLKLSAAFSVSRFNQHSVATAILADLAAQNLPAVHFPEGAFLAGLFHDLGKLLMAVSMPEEAQHVHYRYQMNGHRLTACEEEVLGLDHAELSGLAVTAWKLPEPIQSAVMFHHRPEGERVPAAATDIPLARLLAAADFEVNALGYSVEERRSPADLEPGPYTMQSLGLSEAQMSTILPAFDAELTALSALFR